jgi:hypothetical protein
LPSLAFPLAIAPTNAKRRILSKNI